MQIINDYDLSKATTFHVGGVAKKLYIPNHENELLELLNSELKNEKKLYILSAGSNLLINDNKVFDKVISVREIDKNIINKANGEYYVGASCRIQHVITTINKDGYGGFEELVSLPALFGGIIYMNAGIGAKNSSLFTISDFVVRVKVIDIENKKVIWLDKKDCEFSNRHSLFHNNKYIILGADIKCNKQDISISKERINNRLKKCKTKFERGKGCFGTCFKNANGKLLKIVAKKYPKHGGISFGKINKNWLVNDGSGTFNDTMFLINKCKIIHKILGQKIICEIIIWE